MRLEAVVRNAVSFGNFVLHYQPVYNVVDCRLIGFEALVRIPAEDGSLVMPATFIPIAEDIGLIGKIDDWVMNEACRMAAKWPAYFSVSVNVSPARFADGGVSDLVAAALKRHKLDARRFELEITESLLLSDTNVVMMELRKVKALGVRIAMDDFGSGYSSLCYLWRFPFDKLKIDQAFMWALEGPDKDVRSVLNTIVALGRSLNMKVTAEGVETEDQAKFIRELGVDEVQGFYYARPMPALDAARLIVGEMQRLRAPRTAAAGTGSDACAAAQAG
jgi:EAL domain-containing protein (putative c-di-GMP-specific phosphodiesterase class I)